MISSKSEFELEESCLILFDLDTSCSILLDLEFAGTLGLGSFGDSTYKFGPDGNKGPDIADKFSVLCLSKVFGGEYSAGCNLYFVVKLTFKSWTTLFLL